MKMCALRFGLAYGIAMAILNVLLFTLMHFFGDKIMDLLQKTLSHLPQGMITYVSFSTLQQFVWYFLVGFLLVLFYNLMLGKCCKDCCQGK